MTKEELIVERSWLNRRANRAHPEFQARLEAFNREVTTYNKALNERARTAIKTLKVGDIVHVREDFNYKGLWRIEKIMQKNILLKSMTDTQRVSRLRISADLVTKVEGEDENLINSLDLVGLV